jgi:hypothetical protein
MKKKMKKIVNQSSFIVRCANCNRGQPDRGKRGTCIFCGCQPLPSYSYPPDSGFYPQAKGETQDKRIGRLVAQRRTERAKGYKTTPNH